MPIGIIVNSLAILTGGAAGVLLGNNLSEQLRNNLTLIFGVASMSMGIASIVHLTYLPAVIFAVIIGTAMGELIRLEHSISLAAGKVQAPVARILSQKEEGLSKEEFLQKLVSVIVLFCASGTGIFGSLQSGMTGDHTILISKSILDFFTAAIFGASLGFIVCLICIPQFIIFFLLFLSAVFILPLTTQEMLNDFTACGGILMLATGFRISGIKSFPVANMLPAMVLVMPFSYVWSHVILPLL